ncbi:sulfotransferase family protein [Mangrovactinospora gilvigrisea]|uniref:Sulfotransferase family protein n=1 Tax=Mangrovactinospora gilvigrisea TaxID=1428644 RepID=A0A1J7CAL6_9ACTN|nr:sulfotransferase family protein [Mangrovactinospora gilvigrisea]
MISSVRSGSTLLRVVLDTHPRIHAPHELHLRTLEVNLSRPYTEKSMARIGLDGQELEHMLWDRVLHRELAASGKDLVVDKTPGNALVWRRIHACWPEARYIFLLRHPMSMVHSLMDNKKRPDRTLDATVREVLGYAEAVDEARRSLPGLTVRYEELTADPAAVTRSICDHLGVEWTPRMLDYGRADHGEYTAFLGDWSDTIKSGRIQRGRALPAADEVPEALRALTAKWGYA